MDSYEKASLGFWNVSSFKELKEHSFFENDFNFVPYKDRVEVAVWLATYILKNQDEFVDSLRIFPVGMEKEYKNYLKKCCCGFFDMRVKVDSGNYYYIGYNYGH
jgi:hypothetical protein